MKITKEEGRTEKTRTKVSKSSKTVALGDIVAIRLKAKHYALGKIVFLSKKVKGLLVLLVFNKVFSDPSLPEKCPKRYLPPIWTGIPYIKEGRWTKIGSAPLTKEDEDSSMYAVVGSVTHGDKHLRKPTRDDFK